MSIGRRSAVIGLLVAACAFTVFDYGDRHMTPADQVLQQRRMSDHADIVQKRAPSPYRYRVLVPYGLSLAIVVAARVESPAAAFRHVYDAYYLAAFVWMLWTLVVYLTVWFTSEQALVGALFVAAVMGMGLRYDL